MPLHPLHRMLLGATVTLFLGVLLSDVAYGQSYEVQWKNFASWLIVGGLLVGGLTLLWALIMLLRADGRSGSPVVYVLLLVASWIFGFGNALIHAKDAWASMPTATVLSVIVVALAGAATWLGFVSLRAQAAS